MYFVNVIVLIYTKISPGLSLGPIITLKKVRKVETRPDHLREDSHKYE